MSRPVEDKKGEQWEQVFSTNSAYQVEILKALLDEENIVSIIVNKQDSSYLVGEVELYVKCDDMLRAKQVVTKFNSHE